MKVLIAAAIFGISLGNYGCSNEANVAGMPMAAEELPVTSPGATLQTAADANAEVETPAVVNPPAVVVNAPAVVNPPLVNNPPAVVNPPAVIPPTALNPPVAAPTNWVDVTTVGPNLTMQDISDKGTEWYKGLKWTNKRPDANWVGAIDYCRSLNYNGVSGWRLPTRSELVGAYQHKVERVAKKDWMTSSDLQNYYWSSSSYEGDFFNSAYRLNFTGGQHPFFKSYASAVVCVQ